MITVVNLPDSLLTEKQFARKQLWENNPDVIELQLVKIGNILTLQDDNYIEITIPGRNLTKEFRGTYVEFDTIGNYSWTGELM
ncbi:MAG TPA: hypothetical protein VI603_10475, partial [Saprospiraceae bacterium]|nr:hypothetical protein [Saprospiraceae bacterium]